MRNRPEKVLRAISSIPADRDDVEIVVVDDASTDGTAEAIRERYGDRVRLVRHDRPRGAGAARNTGAREALGEWCFILDSDNWLLPNALTTIEGCLADGGSSAGVVLMGSMLGGREPMGKKSIPDGLTTSDDLLVGRIAGEYCAMPRRAALLETPYNEWPGRDNSGVTWLRIGDLRGMAAFDRPVLGYDAGGSDRLSARERTLSDPAEAVRCQEQLLDLFGERLHRLDPYLWAEHVAREAVYRVLAGERRRGASSVVRALRASRRRPVLLAAAAVTAGPSLSRLAFRRLA